MNKAIKEGALQNDHTKTEKPIIRGFSLTGCILAFGVCFINLISYLITFVSLIIIVLAMKGGQSYGAIPGLIVLYGINVLFSVFLIVLIIMTLILTKKSLIRYNDKKNYPLTLFIFLCITFVQFFVVTLFPTNILLPISGVVFMITIAIAATFIMIDFYKNRKLIKILNTNNNKNISNNNIDNDNV